MALAARHGTAAVATGPVGRSQHGATGPVWSRPGWAVGRFLGGPSERRACPAARAACPSVRAARAGRAACPAARAACPAVRCARAGRAPGDPGSGEARSVRSHRKWAVGRFLGGPSDRRAGPSAGRATKRRALPRRRYRGPVAGRCQRGRPA